jgi:putative restriction endonuclease
VRGYIGNTDFDWYSRLSAIENLDEVNFWQPSGARDFHAVSPGEPFLFKLKSPHNAIAGFGFLAIARRLPLSFAWEAFGSKNGVASLRELRERIARYRRQPVAPTEDPIIGCLMVAEPVFFPESLWIPQPTDWARNAVQGVTYDLATGEGARVWRDCLDRVAGRELLTGAMAGATQAAERYGAPQLVRPRLGQGTFRVAVTDAYGQACAVTTEHSLPVLEAAHIRPYAEGGEHATSNGLLLRADLHRLYDRGYVTVTPDLKFRVSPRLRADYGNGRAYEALDGRIIQVPGANGDQPDRELLDWHFRTKFVA